MIKAREPGRERFRVVKVTYGVNSMDYREILGFMLGDSKPKTS